MTEQNNNRDEAKQKNSSGNIGPILTLVFLGIVLLRFIFQLTEDGWDVASKQNSGGALIFILACIAAYIVSAELIYTRVSKTVGRTMGWILALFVAFFIIGKAPSCSSVNDREPADTYYRR